jgi:transposase-like protein
MLERLIQEIRRREKVIRIFPNKTSAWRLVGALLAEKHEEWSTGRRYLKMEEFYGWQAERTEEDAGDLQPKSSNHTLQPA